MRIECADIGKLMHPYLDGELVQTDRADLELHLRDCAACRAQVETETVFKARLRAKLAPPPAPAELSARVRAALDHIDGGVPARRRPVMSWLAPGTAILAAAASIALFVAVHARGAPEPPIVADAISAHRRNLPPEVTGSVDAASNYLGQYVPVSTRVPRFSKDRGVSFVGARVGRVRDRDAAMYTFDVEGSRGRRQMTVLVFDPTGLRLTGAHRRLGGHDVYVTQDRGFTVVAFISKGAGYAYTSDLPDDEMLQIISSLGGL